MTLTTITSYWQRPAQLLHWVKAVKRASVPEVNHVVFFVGETPPSWWEKETCGTRILALLRNEKPGMSIGHYHNLGASQSRAEWIMKLDVDALPNEIYFQELLPILDQAKPRQWFNGGMFYLNEEGTQVVLKGDPLSVPIYVTIINTRYQYCMHAFPQATSYICRREDYLKLGGCDDRFAGWGWEDYQQIYMLEKYQRGEDPLPGPVTLENVTQRCRDEISRPKAMELWKKSKSLALLHCCHSHASRVGAEKNREVLLSCIKLQRT